MQLVDDVPVDDRLHDRSVNRVSQRSAKCLHESLLSCQSFKLSKRGIRASPHDARSSTRPLEQARAGLTEESPPGGGIRWGRRAVVTFGKKHGGFEISP